MSKTAIRKFVLVVITAAGLSLVAVTGGVAAGQTSDPPDKATYEFLEEFHGHVCAGSIFGARLSSAAKDALRSAGGKGRLKAVYYKLSCPVDGIQVTIGTTYGNGDLVVEDRGEHRLVLTASGNNVQVEAMLTRKAEDEGLRFRELKKKAKALREGSEERKSLEGEVDEILDWLMYAPTPEVVVVTQLQAR